MSSKFMMIEGIDGSGKSTAFSAIKQWAVSKDLKVLDLKSYCEQHNSFPESEDLFEYDIIFSSEPSYSFVGKAIRNELILDEKHKYSASSLAHAFSLDREILYNRIILPALKKGKMIVQERGFVSSMVYQPLQEKLQLNEIMHLPGNQLAIKHPPDLILVLKISAEQAVSRVNARFAQNFSQFDNLFFQRKAEERYSGVWLRGIIEKMGSRLVYFDTTETTADQNKANAVRLFAELSKGDFKQKEIQKEL